MPLNIHAILEAGALERGRFEFASGIQANNHFSAEHLLNDPSVKSRIVGCLTILASGFQPDALVSVPSGADSWVDEMAKRPQLKEIPVIKLKKLANIDGRWGFDFANGQSRALAAQTERKVIVDDVGTRLTTLGKVLKVPTIGDSSEGLVGIWFRGKSKDRTDAEIPSRWVVEEYIPAVINHKHKLYPYLLKGPDLRKNKRARKSY